MLNGKWIYIDTLHLYTHIHTLVVASVWMYTRPTVYHSTCIWLKNTLITSDRHHMQSFTTFSSYISRAHTMLLPNKQAHQQNKLSPHVSAIGVTGSGKYKTSSVNKHPEKGQLLAGGNATCDSLMLLSAKHGCEEHCNVEDELTGKRVVCFLWTKEKHY